MSKYDYLHALYQALLPLDAEKRNTIMRDIESQFSYAEENGIDEKDITDKLGSPTVYAKAFITQSITDNDVSVTLEGGFESIPPNKPITQPDSIRYEEKSPDNELEPYEEPVHLIEQVHYIEPVSYVKSEPEEEQKNRKNKIYISPQSVVINKTAANPVQMLLVGLGMTLFNLIIMLGPFIGLWAIVFALVTAGLSLFISGLIIIISGLFAIPFSFVIVPLVIVSHPVLLFSFSFLITGIGGLLTIMTIYMIRFFGMLTARYVGWNVKVIRGY